MRVLPARLAATSTLLGVIAACLAADCRNEDGTREKPSAPTAPSPPASVTAVTVSGLDGVLSMGSTVQLKATAALSDGTLLDVTNEASWQSSNESVATVVSGGTVTVTGAGEADISATVQGVSGARHLVAGRPLHTIAGVVHETFATSLIVEAARVEVVGGAYDGRVLMTDALGRFELHSVAEAGFALKVKKSGYEDAQYDVVLLPRDAHPDIAIRPIPVGPPPVARLSLYIDSAGSTGGLLGFTPIRFDGTASSAERPTYFLEFGDGNATTASVAVHPCERRDLLTAKLTVTDRFGRVSSASSRFACLGLVHPQGPIYSVTYGWINGTCAATCASFRRLGFQVQNGAAFSGFYTGPEGELKHFTGRLSGQNSISITLDDGLMSFVGYVVLKDTWRTMPCCAYFVDRHLILTVRGGTADGMTLDFEFYDPF